MIAQVRRSPSSPNGSSDTPGRSGSRLRPGAAHRPIIPALAILAVAAAIGIAILAATPHPPHSHEARRNQRGWDR